MFVSHFNSFLRGGAATAARQLHQALRGAGIQSRFQHLAGQTFTGRQCTETEDGEYYSTHWPGKGTLRDSVDRIRFRLHRQRFKRATGGTKPGAEIFTSPHGKPFTPWPPLDHPAADPNAVDAQQHLIHLHWISKFIDFPSFFGSLSGDQAVVWTLHDMNALSGGCHFSGGCERFRLGCGNCPQIKRPGQRDVSFRSFETKRRALQDINLHIVAPSRWLLQQARSSPLLAGARSFTRIPYGMPTDRLYPMQKRFAREALGIETDAFIIGFGAMSLGNRRKGAAELAAALEHVGPNPNVRCLVFGSGTLSESNKELPQTIHVGSVQDDRTRRLVYSAADAFVLPSTEDNLPLTGLEAMACGTPVIGFDAGGIPDYVIPGKTGLLADTGNAAQLASRLKTAIANPQAIKAMGGQARELILDQYQADTEAQRYIELYRTLVDSGEQSQRRAA
ncbi:Capsular glucan synthase [Stieleria maiorica]|uniref:Capsular glucan synthase n=1 Tax=Stieleria maiorica TaxID=2795974 RepID=A0A5B9MSN0_9BACT|nr:glycosyltransferase [Stieleria maiorica]QEG02816.1 Capsular glucan synthase [Stieleria maiorica]